VVDNFLGLHPIYISGVENQEEIKKNVSIFSGVGFPAVGSGKIV
jgi:hypothetical protein